MKKRAPRHNVYSETEAKYMLKHRIYSPATWSDLVKRWEWFDWMRKNIWSKK